VNTGGWSTIEYFPQVTVTPPVDSGQRSPPTELVMDNSVLHQLLQNLDPT